MPTFFHFACCREFISFCFPLVSLLCYFYPSMVVFYVTAVCCLCFLWFEKVVYFVFPSFPQSTHCSACLDFGTKSWVLIRQLSLPIVLLVAMLFSSPIAIPFFCAFRSNTESWPPLIQSLCLSLLQRRRRYLGRNRCQCCFLLVFRFRSSLGFLFFLNVAYLIFMLLAIYFFCIFFLFVQWVEASSVLFMVSIFRVRLLRSMFHTRRPM